MPKSVMEYFGSKNNEEKHETKENVQTSKNNFFHVQIYMKITCQRLMIIML